jgi:hypothetical protein
MNWVAGSGEAVIPTLEAVGNPARRVCRVQDRSENVLEVILM